MHSDLCALDSDRGFGPRVKSECRPFDFTLLFEDIFCFALPAVSFLCLLPPRLQSLWRSPRETNSHRRIVWKLALYVLLLLFSLLLLVFRHQEPRLGTPASIAAPTLVSVAVIAAGILSYLEDQRSIRPSDLLVLYLSVSTLLSLAAVRSYWLVPASTKLSAVAIATALLTAVLVVVESLPRAHLLRPVGKGESKEQLVGFWSRGFFIWALPFLRQGYSNILTLAQVPGVDRELREDATWARLQGYWECMQSGRYRLLRATYLSHWRLLVSAAPPRLALSAFTFCQPFLISSSVSYLAARPSGSDDEYFGPALVFAFLLVYLGIAISRAFYWRQTNRTIASMRSCLIAIIYRHTTGVKSVDLKDTAIVTLMGTDVERIALALRFIHELWASTVEVIIALWLLQRQMLWAFLAPLIVTLASVLMTWGVSSRIGAAQTAWNKRVQERVDVTSGMLNNIKTVQMLGMSDIMQKSITRLRLLELKTSEKFRALLITQILLGNIPVTFSPLVTFIVYTIIAVTTKSETLLSSQAFASLSLISLATAPLIKFCQALPSFVQAAACFGRIEEFCLKNSAFAEAARTNNPSRPEHDDISLRDIATESVGKDTQLMSFEQADIAWNSEASPVLQNLTLNLSPGLTAIAGPVASGKSTLLWTILGETVLKAGAMANPPARAAFCSQTPWIIDDTIRHNVTLGLNFDQDWYDFSLASSCLQGDLLALPKCDMTLAGANGSSLSGGQRQRVALARAIYSRLPIVLLDDVMSGLDPKTAATLSTGLFGKDGYFRANNISVVVASNDRRILCHVDTVVLLEAGRIVQYGPFEEFVQWNAEHGASDDPPETKGDDDHSSISVIDISQSPELQHDQTGDPADTSSDKDERRNGNWSVYVYYVRSAGLFSVVAWAVCLLLGAVCNGISTVWISNWTDDNEAHPNQRLGYYLGIYAMLVILTNMGMAGELWFSFMTIISDTALKLHADLLHTTLKAPISFFQQTDIGTILNRFSQDMDMIDMVLPNQAAQFTTGAAYCIVQLLIICVLGKYLLVTIPVCLAVLFFLQRSYLRTSRQVRLLDIEAKAPLYKHFLETLSGVSTIRAYGRSSAFHRQHQQMLDSAQAPYYMLLCIQQWLVLVLDLMVGGLAVVIAAIALGPASNSISISAGSLGVALVLILQFNNLLSQSIQAWTKLETSIGAVHRVQQFVRDTPQEAVGRCVAEAGWPAQGSIRFENVSVTYVAGGPYVLKGLNLDIQPGEKIAICGPSGSGKSTILMSLLRIIEVQGHILIDDTDISHLSGDDLRSRLNVLPQEPVFFPGTIGANLDARALSSPAVIQEAVKKVGLWGKVRDSGGLDAALDPTEWSQGEKQLLCLARAMLTPSKILALDEATSSVDNETESTMLDVIGSSFAEHTVISVVHRFARMEQYDRVAVLNQGRIVEHDAPQNLLNRDSMFRELFRAYASGH